MGEGKWYNNIKYRNLLVAKEIAMAWKEIIIAVFTNLIILLIILKHLGLTENILEVFKYKSTSGDAKLNSKTQKELFERKYYKDVAIEEIVHLLKEWTTVIFNFEESFAIKSRKKVKNDHEKDKVIKEQVIKMNTEVLLYCSSKTITLYSIYMQDVFTGYFKGEMEELEQLYIVALLISNIKYDYTNDFLDPFNILEMKIIYCV